MNKQRLLRLAEILQQLPPRHPFSHNGQTNECDAISIMARNENDFGPRAFKQTLYHYAVESLGLSHTMFRWLFDPEWQSTEPTPYGCAIRIEMLLEWGDLPVGWHGWMLGNRPLPYSKDRVHAMRTIAANKNRELEGKMTITTT